MKNEYRSCNVKNRSLFCSDNLDILKNINSNCIDLIYLDPPFNKKKKFSASIGSIAEGASFLDVFKEKDVKEEWIQTIKEDNPDLYELLMSVKKWGDRSNSSYNFAYLAYMAIRLLEMRRILKDTGSLYLHCDPTMSHYLKLLLDIIFGEDCFRNEIVWGYRGGGVPTGAFARKHDIILFYTKERSVFNRQYVEYSEASKHLVRSKGGVSIDGKKRDLERGAAMPDWWTDINSLQTWSRERTGYPTQKPLKLLERIVSTSSYEGDIVLDPFCGCATTCVAAEKLRRKWIGIDVSVKAYEIVKKRLVKEITSSELSLDSQKDVHFSTSSPRRTDTEATEIEK